jgi:two-component system cell cycle response regulator
MRLMRARRDGEKGGVTIVLGDIDHFKNVNDTYGYGTGGEVLREVACRPGDSVRSYDVLSRHGGEEFLIVLNGCRTRMAASRAEAIRRAIRKRPVESAAGTLAISMSLGVAGTEDWQDANPEQLIKEADVALYRATARCLRSFRRFSCPARQRIKCPRFDRALSSGMTRWPAT